MIRFLFLAAILLLIFTGCSTPRITELQQVQKTVARAYADGADHLAPEHFQAASGALKQAQEHARLGEADQARQFFPLAEYHARQAIEAARKEKERIEEALRARELSEKRKEEATTRAMPKTPAAEPEKKAASRRKLEEASSTPVPEPVTLVSSYAVLAGDTLWKISARQEIYDDPLLWPLLYRANRDQIKDPRQVYPGQTLEVPRGVDEKGKDEARSQARQSEIFPVDTLLPASAVTRP